MTSSPRGVDVFDHHPDGLARVWRGSIMPLLEEHHYGAPAAELATFELDSLRGSATVPPDGEP